MPSQNHGRTDRKSKPVSGSGAVSGAGEGVLLITVVTGVWMSGSASGVCTGAGTSRSAGEKSSGAAGVWERLICCCTCATGSALGCRLRSLWIWKGISSRSPASSQSRQMYFRGVFFSTSRSSMTARMTMLPWKLAVRMFWNNVFMFDPPRNCQ